MRATFLALLLAAVPASGADAGWIKDVKNKIERTVEKAKDKVGESAECSFTLKGRIFAEDFERYAISEPDDAVPQLDVFPVKHAKIRISEKSLANGNYKTWAETVTDNDGVFNATIRDKDGVARKPCSKGVFVRIEIKFDNEKFDVKKEFDGFAEWLTVLDSKDHFAFAPGTWDFTQPFNRNGVEWEGTRFAFGLDAATENPPQAAFKSLAGMNEDPAHYLHAFGWAQTWAVMDYLADALGEDYGIQKKFTLKLITTDSLYLFGNKMGSTRGGRVMTRFPKRFYYLYSFNYPPFSVMIHELNHVWFTPLFYDGVTGAFGEYVDYALQAFHGGSHDYTEYEHIAFTEGFAEFFSQHYLYKHVNAETFYDGNRSDASGMPQYPYEVVNRPTLWLNGYDDAENLDNFDVTWIHLMNLLLIRNVQKYDFGDVAVGGNGTVAGACDVKGSANEECGKDFSNAAARYPECSRKTIGGITVPDEFLNALACPSAFHFRAENCAIKPWKISFEELLKTVFANPSAGYPEVFDADTADLRSFLERVSGVLGEDKLDAKQIEAFLKIIDPASAQQPYEIMGCESKAPPVNGVIVKP